MTENDKRSRPKPPNRPKRRTNNRADIIDAIEKSFGNATVAASILGIQRRTFYLWIDRLPDSAEVKEILESTREQRVDVAEYQLYKQVQAGNTSAIFYALNNDPYAKKRGWGVQKETPLPPVPIADEGFDITTPPAPDHG